MYIFFNIYWVDVVNVVLIINCERLIYCYESLKYWVWCLLRKGG